MLSYLLLKVLAKGERTQESAPRMTGIQANALTMPRMMGLQANALTMVQRSTTSALVRVNSLIRGTLNG
jgi:hypothetical protein